MEKYKTVKDAIDGFIRELKENNQYKLLPTNEKSSDNYEYNIYNEISLQHELGEFLRNRLEGNYNIFFEKNIYDKEKEEWIKKEVDLILINEKKEKYAIELKFSKGENARIPENMYDFIKDIKFMEQVMSKKGFTDAYNLIIVDSPLYYEVLSNKRKNTIRYDIYKIFRNDKEGVNIKREIDKNIILRKEEIDENKYCRPTGKKEYKGKGFKLKRDYTDKYWKKIFEEDKDNPYRYLFISQKEYEQLAK